MTASPAVNTNLRPMPVPPPDQPSTSVYLPTNMIVRSPFNRHPSLTDDFVESIRQDGVLQNVIVRIVKANIADVSTAPNPLEGHGPSKPFAIGDEIYQLVAGERRWMAAMKVGLHTVPAVIRKLTDAQAQELQLKENEERENLNPIDRSKAYARLVRQYQDDNAGNAKYSRKQAVQDVAERFGKEARIIYQMLQLEALTPILRTKIESGQFPVSFGYELCRREHAEQDSILKWIEIETYRSQGDLPSVRSLQREIAALAEKPKKGIVTVEVKENRSPSLPATDDPAGKAGLEGGSVSSGDAAAPTPKVETPKTSVEKFLNKIDAAIKRTEEGVTVRYKNAPVFLRVGPLPGFVKDALTTRYPELKNGHVLADGRIQLVLGLNGACSYLPVEIVQQQLDLAAKATPAPSEAEKKKAQDAARKQREKELKEQRAANRQGQIEKHYRAMLFTNLVGKLPVNEKSLSMVIPEMITDVLANGIVAPELVAPQLLGWPEPKKPLKGYEYSELDAFAEKHTNKFSAGLLIALLLFQTNGDRGIEKISRSFKIDPAKLKKKAAADFEAARLKVPEPKTPKDKALFGCLTASGVWSKQWDALRRKGATDAEVREWVKNRFGVFGSKCGPGLQSITYKGGENPRVWFKMTESGKPDLAGAELVAEVRRLLNIGEPA